MTTSTDPDQIREDIQRTRADLSDDVNALADSVNPKQVARRQASRVRDVFTGAKEKVMGKASTGTSAAADAVGSAKSTVSEAPGQIIEQTRGNPLAVGLIAFGAGLLAGSLLPASAAERQTAAKVKDTAAPVVSDAAKEVADNLKQPAQDAVSSVTDAASDAAATVKDTGSSAVDDVQGQAQNAKHTIQRQ